MPAVDPPPPPPALPVDPPPTWPAGWGAPPPTWSAVWHEKVRKVEWTIASDGARTEKERETVTITTDVDNMPFVPFSGRPSSIGEQQDRLFPPDGTEQLVDPEKMKMDEMGEANQGSPQPASPQPSALPQRLAPPPSPPPIMPPTGQNCIHRGVWAALERPLRGDLEDPQ